MFHRLVNSVYKKLRGHDLDNVVIPTSVLIEFSLRKASDLIRGYSYRPTYGEVSGIHFRGRGVSISSSKFLRIGSATAIGRDVSIDAFSEQGIRLGSRVTIGSGSSLLATAVIREPGTGISVGDDTAIGRSNIIWGQGGVTIGANCLLGPHVSVFSENHSYSDPSELIRLQGTQRSPVIIQDDCWIGAGAKILAGVVVGQGSVVAAGAVVTRSVDPYSVVAGVPAKTLRTRSTSVPSAEQP